MGSRQLGNRQMNFLARLYERGTGESVATTVSFQDDTILIYLEENGNEPIAVPLDEWEVRVGGSSEDKIVLYALQTGDTLICGDEYFLTAIAEATDNNEIIKQIAKAKKTNSTRLVRQSTGIVAVIICLTMFVGCVGISFFAPRHHGRNHTQRVEETEEAEGTEHASEETPEENAEVPAEEAAATYDGGSYVHSIQSKIRHAWRPPANSKPTQVIVHFSVDKSGKTSNAKIMKSSGNKACDASALKAISDVSPLPKLGSGSPSSVDIEYKFNLNGKPKKAPENNASQSEGSQHEKRYD